VERVGGDRIPIDLELPASPRKTPSSDSICELYHHFKNRHSEESREFHSVPTRTKFAVAAIYLCLTALLIVGAAETYVPRTL
jgi:hypothetical protein